MRISQSLEYYIKTTHLTLTRIYNSLLKEYGLTQTIALILVSISRNGTPITKLATDLGMQDSSLNRQIKRMDRQGLIEKKRDSFDKRVTRVFLTQKGIENRRMIKQLVADFNKEILSSLDQEEVKQFFNTFDKIREHIKAAEAKIIKNKKL